MLNLARSGREISSRDTAATLAAEQFIRSNIPARMHARYASEHAARATDAADAANRWLMAEAVAWQGRGAEHALLSVLDTHGSVVGRCGTVDADLRGLADRAADAARGLLPVPELGPELAEIVQHETGLEIAGQTEESTGLRLLCNRVWRRKLRNQHARMLEQQQQRDGHTCKQAGLYVSDEAMAVTRARWRRSRSVLERIEAVSDDGHVAPLSDLADSSVSNPANRRSELMTRIAGEERIARECGHAALFVTLTVPSKYHRALSAGGQNPRWNGWTPREVHREYLSKLWSRVRAAWGDAGLTFYGLRIAEPHHDGTPHWHLLLFVPVHQKNRLREIFRAYALREDRAELGRRTSARFKTELIDWERGSASGYVAKYVCKNVDGATPMGELSEMDYEANQQTVATTAERVRAWASVWGIRQFQFFGTAPVSLWRELRRVAADTDPTTLHRPSGNALRTLAAAADRGDWQAYAVGLRQARQQVSLYREPVTEPNRYGEARADAVRGVQAHHPDGFHEITVTRYRVWVFEFRRRAQPVAPWTGVNNCRDTGSSSQRTGNHWSKNHDRNCKTDSPGIRSTRKLETVAAGVRRRQHVAGPRGGTALHGGMHRAAEHHRH